MIHMRAFTGFEEKNLTFLTQKSIEYTLVQITATGYKKSILDATEPMRQYFLDRGMHDYSAQLQGQEHKVYQTSFILDDTSAFPTSTSLYRPETKKGDPRIWTNNLKKYCQPDDILVMIYFSAKLYIINLTHIDFVKVCQSAIITPLKDLIDSIHTDVMSVSDELTGMLREIAKDWHPVETTGDTAIGRTIETLLGIEMNSSKLPDYKGIELKSFREKRPSIKKNLFTQVPDWKNSHLKSAKEIVKKYGYLRDGKLTYQNTLTCLSPNSQNLGLTLYLPQDILAIEEKKEKAGRNLEITYPKVADVALWQLPVLHQRLLSKHHETFWIEVESKMENGTEMFRPTIVEHTKNPIVSQFDNLLDTGYITVDLLLSRPSGNGDTIAFKLKKKAAPMLFPNSSMIQLR